MSKNQKNHKKGEELLDKKKKFLKDIIDAQKYIKNEDVLESIQNETLYNLDQKKENQKHKFSNMCDWHYLAAFFIKNKIFGPKEIDGFPFWIKQASEIRSNETKTLKEFYDICSKNLSILNKLNINEKSIDFLANSNFFLLNREENDCSEEIKFLIPEFIYFISESFRPIFIRFYSNSDPHDLKHIKTQMYQSWENNIKLIPSEIYEYLTTGGRNAFYQKFRNLLKMIFEHPELYQIIHFYQNQLLEEFTSNLLLNIDDSYCDIYYNLLENYKKGPRYNLDKYFDINDSIIDLGVSRLGLDNFYDNFKNLLITSDLLPTFPESFYNEINSLEQFVLDYLVKRGSMNYIMTKYDYYTKMQDYVTSQTTGKSMDFYLETIKFDDLMFEHIDTSKKINQKLKEKKKIQKYINALFNMQKKTSYVLKFNYINSIVKIFYEQKSNKLKETTKKTGRNIFSLITNIFTRKNDENQNDGDSNEKLFNVFEVIKDPSKLKKDYLEFLDNFKDLFTPNSVLQKENDKEFRYDWNTFLIFSLLKDITFDKFLAYRPEVEIFDYSYTNLFYANQSKTIETIEQNDEENGNDEGVNENNNNENFEEDINNDDSFEENINNDDTLEENSFIDVKIEKQYESLVLDLMNAFSDNTNPAQKVLDVYDSLKKISKFFAKEGKALFEQKIKENNVDKMENSGWNIPFNIFDFVCLPKFFSSMIFMFDYYFLLFERNSQLKTLFLQIYNYAIKKYYSKDQLHFDIVSSEEDLYQHLLLCRKSIKMIFVGSNKKGTIKNTILKNALKNSISGTYEENEFYPLDEFIETAKEVTCYFFKDSTFYVCTIMLFDKVDELKYLNLQIDENKKQFAAFLISPQEIVERSEVDKLVNLIKDINSTHIICNANTHIVYMSDYKENAIIHNSITFDIKKIKIITKY